MTARPRRVQIADAGDCLIALPGSDGTRSEIALVRVLKRPVVALRSWHDVKNVIHATTPTDAAHRAVALARRR